MRTVSNKASGNYVSHMLHFSVHVCTVHVLYCTVLFALYRGHGKYSRSSVDLCILVHRSSDNPSLTVGPLVMLSKRQVRSFVGTSCMLEEGSYTVVCAAFSHWGSRE